MSAEPLDNPDPRLRFETTPYEPDGGCSPLGFLLILLLGVPCALAAGVLSVLLYPTLYPVFFLIPEWTLYLLAYLAAFLLLTVPMILAYRFAVSWGKVRNPLATTVAAVLVWLPMITVTLLLWIPVHKANIGWQHLTMDIGVSYLGYSLAAFASLAIMIAGGRHLASRPFCSVCRTWKKVHFKRAVNVPTAVLLRAVQTGDVVSLADHDVSREGPLMLTVTACPNCGLEAPAEVKVEQTIVNPQGHRQVVPLTHVRYPGEAAVVLEAIFQPEPARQRRSSEPG